MYGRAEDAAGWDGTMSHLCPVRRLEYGQEEISHGFGVGFSGAISAWLKEQDGVLVWWYGVTQLDQ